MSEQIQELIDKIKSEGIQAADDKAKKIEEQAKKQAANIIDEAKMSSEKIINEAKQEISKMQDASNMALKQASRDMLITLRQNINDALFRILNAEVGSALSSESLSSILENVIKDAVSGKKDANIIVNLGKDDLKALKDDFVGRLKKAVKQPIELRDKETIEKGFLISFDEGKTSFDFSDKGLAEFLGKYLNEEIAKLLVESVE